MSHYKRSTTEKRSTRSSRKHTTRGSLEKQRLIPIVEKEESDVNLIVHDIMTDVLETAMTKIYERYLERQTIKFVVHCAHEALMRLIRIHFYQHNDYVRKPEFWNSDKAVAPSPPDSWALNQVPIYKHITDGYELNTISQIKLEMEGKGDEIATRPDLLDLVSQPSENLFDDMRAIVYEIVDNLPLREENIVDMDAVSEISAFTSVVQGRNHYAQFKIKPQISRISFGGSTMFRLPKIDLPESGNSRRQGNNEESSKEEKLPPIRTCARYKCRSNSEQEAKSKKVKK